MHPELDPPPVSNILSNFYFMTQVIITTKSALTRYPNPIKTNMFLPIAKSFAKPLKKIYKMIKLDTYQIYYLPTIWPTGLDGW